MEFAIGGESPLVQQEQMYPQRERHPVQVEHQTVRLRACLLQVPVVGGDQNAPNAAQRISTATRARTAAP